MKKRDEARENPAQVRLLVTEPASRTEKWRFPAGPKVQDFQLPRQGARV